MDNSQHQPPILQTPGDTQSQQEFMTTSTVEELPVEILQGVFLLIDCDTILSFLSTCRRFYDATSSHLLWYGVVNQIHAFTGIRPEEELESYSIKELRGWCMRRLRAHDLWNSQSEIVSFNTTPQKLDDFDKEQLELNGVEVLPGGRWMIILTTTAKCCYVDLDSSKKLRQQLVRPRKQLEGSECGEYKFCVGIDHSQPRLTFQLAIIGFKSQLIKIYRVVLKGHGQAARLVARHTSTLRGPRPGITYRSAINKCYFIDRFTHMEDTLMNGRTVILRLFYYNDSMKYIDRGDKMTYVSILSGSNHCRCLGFISTFFFVSHKLVYHEHTSILQICEITTCNKTDIPRAINVLRTIPVAGDPLGLLMSPVYLFPNACRIIVFINGEIQQVSIPHDNPQDSRVLVLGRHPINWLSSHKISPCVRVNYSTTILTHHATTEEEEEAPQMFTYERNDGGSLQYTTLSLPYRPYLCDRLILLAEIGRIVKYDYFGDASIVDSVHPRYIP